MKVLQTLLAVGLIGVVAAAATWVPVRYPFILQKLGLEKPPTVADTTDKPVEAEPKTEPKAEPTPAPTPAPKPAEPAPEPAKPKTATTNADVRLRSGKSTSSTAITTILSGTIVTLGEDADAEWQQVTYNNQTGYVFKQYLTY